MRQPHDEELASVSVDDSSATMPEDRHRPIGKTDLRKARIEAALAMRAHIRTSSARRRPIRRRARCLAATRSSSSKIGARTPICS